MRKWSTEFLFLFKIHKLGFIGKVIEYPSKAPNAFHWTSFGTKCDLS